MRLTVIKARMNWLGNYLVGTDVQPRESDHDFRHHRHLGRDTRPCLSCRRGTLFQNGFQREAQAGFGKLWLRSASASAGEGQALALGQSACQLAFLVAGQSASLFLLHFLEKPGLP